MEGKLCERLYVSCKYDTMRIFLPNMIHCSNKKKKKSQTIPASILITRAQQLPHLLNCKTSLEKSDGWLAAIKIKKIWAHMFEIKWKVQWWGRSFCDILSIFIVCWSYRRGKSCVKCKEEAVVVTRINHDAFCRYVYMKISFFSFYVSWFYFMHYRHTDSLGNRLLVMGYLPTL